MSDITEQARKAAAASEYTIEPLGAIDAYYGTVDATTTSPVAQGDSFEFSYNALYSQW